MKIFFYYCLGDFCTPPQTDPCTVRDGIVRSHYDFDRDSIHRVVVNDSGMIIRENIITFSDLCNYAFMEEK